AWAAEGGDQRLEGRPVERRKTWSAGRLEGAEATTEDVEVRGARAQREDRGERAGQRDTPRQRAALGRGHPEGEQDEERRQRLSDPMSHHVGDRLGALASRPGERDEEHLGRGPVQRVPERTVGAPQKQDGRQPPPERRPQAAREQQDRKDRERARYAGAVEEHAHEPEL